MTHTQARLIRDRRRSLNISEETFAKQIGKSRSFVRQIEAGKQVMTNPPTVTITAQTLDLNEDDLWLAANRLPPDIAAYLINHPNLVSALRDRLSSAL